MEKFYYTFGTDPGFPYQQGWVEVHAANWETAHQIFRSHYPDRHLNTLNCAFFYNETQWRNMNPECNWTGWRCYAIHTTEQTEGEHYVDRPA